MGNTRRIERDSDGNILPEWNPAETNKQIRLLLNCFIKKVYIGYTATPYANIFIYRDENPHPELGHDLFPRNFLVNLPQPSNYIGPEVLFGLDENEDDVDLSSNK